MTTWEPEGTMLMRFIHGETNAEETVQIEEWASADNKNEKILLQIARICFAQETQERISSRDSLNAYNHVKHRINSRKYRRLTKRYLLAAACAAGFILLSGFFSYLYESSVRPLAKQITVISNPGMRTRIMLPDSSIAYLNSGSSLTYSQYFTIRDKERRFNLKGEGYFKVKHDAKIPFIVSVNNGRMSIRATGTEFDVQAYSEDDNVRVTLVEGSVVLSMKKQNGQYNYAKLTQPQKVDYNFRSEKMNMADENELAQGAVYSLKSEKMDIKSVNSASETSWRSGRLVFNNMPLPDLLQKLTHFYNVQFIVRDPVIYSYSFTGTFDNKQLSQVLDYLKISSRMDYKIVDASDDDSENVHYSTVILFKKDK